MPASDAIVAYHDILAQGHAESTHDIVFGSLQRRDILWAGRPVCTVLRPLFFGASTYEGLLRAARVIARATSVLFQRLLEDESLLASLRLPPGLTALLRLEPVGTDASLAGRLDGFLAADGEVRFIEYNDGDPGGILLVDMLRELFDQTPAMMELKRRFSCGFVSPSMAARRALRERGERMKLAGLPRIGLVHTTTGSVDFYREPAMLARSLSEEGYQIADAQVADVEYRGTTLYCAGQAVDLVFTGDIYAVLQQWDVEHPLMRALSDGNVQLVSGVRHAILHNTKALFVLLSDPQYAYLFAEDDARRLRRHVPWTRHLQDGMTTDSDGCPVDLLPFIAEHQDALVLKPALGYGGAGVVLGSEASQEKWQATISAAADEPYVVQSRVEIPTEPFARWDGSDVCIEQLGFDACPYLWNKYPEGLVGRVSASSLMNVTAGAASVTAVYIVGPIG